MNTCADCGTPCNGARCRPCYERTRERRLRELVCPDCGAMRTVNYKTYWASMQRKVPGRCEPCGKAAFKKEARANARAVIASGVKTCPGCDRTLAHDRFSRCTKHLDGLATYCKDCDREQIRTWYAANVGRAAESSRRWAEANPLARRSIVHNFYGLARDPEGERIDHVALMEEHGWACHICGGAIARLSELDFDHVIPFIGGGRHVAANVRPSHSSCNARKGQREGTQWQ